MSKVLKLNPEDALFIGKRIRVEIEELNRRGSKRVIKKMDKAMAVIASYSGRKKAKFHAATVEKSIIEIEGVFDRHYPEGADRVRHLNAMRKMRKYAKDRENIKTKKYNVPVSASTRKILQDFKKVNELSSLGDAVESLAKKWKREAQTEKNESNKKDGLDES